MGKDMNLNYPMHFTFFFLNLRFYVSSFLSRYFFNLFFITNFYTNNSCVHPHRIKTQHSTLNFLASMWNLTIWMNIIFNSIRLIAVISMPLKAKMYSFSWHSFSSRSDAKLAINKQKPIVNDSTVLYIGVTMIIVSTWMKIHPT